MSTKTALTSKTGMFDWMSRCICECKPRWTQRL